MSVDDEVALRLAMIEVAKALAVIEKSQVVRLRVLAVYEDGTMTHSQIRRAYSSEGVKYH